MKRQARRPDRSSRYLSLLLLIAALLTLVAGRLVWLQGFSAPAYAAKAEKQRMWDIDLPPKRGAIYDREGVSLASSVDAETIYANPRLVKDPKGAAEALAGVLGGDAKEYEQKLRKDAGFVYIARKVDSDRAKVIEDMDIAGIDFADDSRRSYPAGSLAGQVLGFVGVDDRGLAGLELEYDKLIGGVPGHLLAERDRRGGLIPGGVKRSEEPVEGKSVMLTIDADIQFQAQNELNKAVKQYKAKGGTVVVMDPRNGEILAMASYPGFDPNAFGKAKPDAIRNKAVTDAYEPGSTMKALTAAAVIDQGLFTPASKFSLPPTLKVGGRTIHESHARGSVRWSLTQIVEKSSNVGAVKLGMALGKTKLEDYLRRFGMSSSTGVDFPGEAYGWLPPAGEWSASSIGNIPFGQGVSATPLQMAVALSAIANGGELVTPHFLKQVPSDPGAVPDWPKKRIISSKASSLMVSVLRSVVTAGTGSEAAVEGYAVAGKTGTAQKAMPGGRGYVGGKYVASFAGFLPAEDPQVLIIVTVDEPRAGIYGGTVAAPTFSRIAAFSVAHLTVPPSPKPKLTPWPTTGKQAVPNNVTQTQRQKGKESTEAAVPGKERDDDTDAGR